MADASREPPWEAQEQAAANGCWDCSERGTTVLLNTGTSWAAGDTVKEGTGLILPVTPALISIRGFLVVFF